jgi:hypothetical protein
MKYIRGSAVLGSSFRVFRFCSQYTTAGLSWNDKLKKIMIPAFETRKG